MRFRTFVIDQLGLGFGFSLDLQPGYERALSIVVWKRVFVVSWGKADQYDWDDQ